MKAVASVAVCDNQGRILMGKRRDNGRWTLPGGHLEANESIHDGALRELFEEAGVEAHGLTHLNSTIVTKENGDQFLVHGFQCAGEPDRVTSVGDPDEEVSEWKWIDCSMGLPKGVEKMLHNKEDVVLGALGLQKSEIYIADQVRGGTKLWLETTRRQELHYVMRKSTEGERQLGFYIPGQAKDGFYVEALEKAGSRPHKYLRKLMGRDGKWQYFYHEPGQHGRQIDEEAINHLKTAAEEHGHQGAKDLMSTMQEHSKEKINLLRQLATEHSHAGAKKQLTSMGISHEKEEKPLHQRVLGPTSELGKPMGDEQANRTRARILSNVSQRVHGHLSSHPQSPFQKKLVENGITHDQLKEALEGKKSVKGMVKAVNEHMKKIDDAHEGAGTPQNGAAERAGGYGNLGHQEAIKAMRETDAIHRDTEEHLKENRGSEDWKSQDETHKAHQAEAAERVAQAAEAERRQRESEARATRELEGSMAQHMASLVEGGLTTEQQVKLQKFFNDNFENREDGQTMRKEDWPYDFSSSGANVKIKKINISERGISMSLQATDSRGRKFFDEDEDGTDWSRTWSVTSNGGVQIYNSFLKVKEDMRGETKIGSLVNASQMKLLKAYSPKGQIKVHAALDVGGYNWANQGFAFESSGELNDFRSMFRRYLANKGIALSEADMQKFKLPCHFSSFDVGVYEKREINGKEVDVHLGKAFLLGKDWHGVLPVSKMKDTNPAYKFFQNYSQMRTDTWKVLEPEYKALVTRETGSRSTQTSTRGSSGSRSGSSPAPTRSVRLPRGYRDWTHARLTEWHQANQQNVSVAQHNNLTWARNAARRRENAAQGEDYDARNAG